MLPNVNSNIDSFHELSDALDPCINKSPTFQQFT